MEVSGETKKEKAPSVCKSFENWLKADEENVFNI